MQTAPNPVYLRPDRPFPDSALSMEKQIYKKTRSKKINIDYVCEVGVFLPHMSNIADYIIKDKIKATLVEPDPKCQSAIKEFFRDYKNVTVLPFAIFDHNGTLELVQRSQSTFVATLPYSPATVNDRYLIKKEDTFTVECRRFDSVDNGAIDLLSIDTEGSEWYVLKYLISRPIVISVETHGKSYINPFMAEITGWMVDNGYERWFKDKADTVYYKKDAFTLSGLEKIQLVMMDARVAMRRARKRFGKFLSQERNANG
jgi:FkbM family methyltransferase